MKPVVLALVGWLAVAVPLTAQSGNQAAANQANQAQLRLVVVDQTGAAEGPESLLLSGPQLP